MRTEIKALSNLKRLIHIAGVALVMTLTLGVAVAISGHPALASAAPSARPSFVPQRALPAQAIAPVMHTSAPSELMHDVPAVEAKSVATVSMPHSHTVRMLVTAYCPCAKCCGENASGITASGKLVTENGGQFVAADASLPFGTKLIIPGYASNTVEVLDRGGAIRGNHIDVFFPTHQQALEWGRRFVDVTILD